VKPFVRNGRGRANPRHLFTGTIPVEIFNHIFAPVLEHIIATNQLQVGPTSLQELRVFIDLVFYIWPS
jgi:hypothetical protein